MFSSVLLRGLAEVGDQIQRVTYRPRWGYSPLFRCKSLKDFVYAMEDSVLSTAHTYKNERTGVIVTLIPLRHFAHPQFFHQVDLLCRQHQSVLVEGRTSVTGAPHSTVVPPRELLGSVRPEECEDLEGWEPREVERFWQPFSWGVKDSSTLTVVHAADKYDYEALPWWCSLRYNVPLIGGLAREMHCLSMIDRLKESGYQSFAIPWGAAHMPIFHEMLIDNGYENIGMCSLVVVNRIDGDISAGEHEKILRLQKRREKLRSVLWLVGIVYVLFIMWSFVTVDYIKG
uniref:Uncharacterized protein TCIL3000_10_11170 n=1 Tax=Trypanosoma congolense (strain IL3000) TaxID=1068625 RepID=G0UY71_TRYCI|nr:unnamed protein product [Trypanosoma congolense IL3000]